MLTKEMTPSEELEHVWNHIRHVQEIGHRMALALMKSDPYLGRMLLSNVLHHDSSKFQGIEWEHLQTGDSLLPEVIKHHNSTNPHHPEYWGSIHNMPDVFVAEMVCDWTARSNEFGTSLYDWVDVKAPLRFKYEINSPIHLKIHHFMSHILEKPFS
jgi:hypothetical protein